MKIAVLGAAGGIGQPLSLLLKMQLPAGSELALYDPAPMTRGVAVDLSHIPTRVQVSGFAGADPSAALAGADIVLIAAGIARKPGMERSDLFKFNAGIIVDLVQHCARVCPQALLAIITGVASLIRTARRPELEGRLQALSGIALALVWIAGVTVLLLIVAKKTI